MKNNFCASILILFSLNELSSQTLVKTYYDFQKTRVNEVYYVNAKGEKNGAYKTYSSDNGVLTEEANFLNGELNGVHKLYNWGNGKAIIRQSETYVQGIKTGEAKYYDGEKTMILLAHGNLVNGKREGIWEYITKIESDMPEGFNYYKNTAEFKNDVPIKEGDVAYYYPSGKLFYDTKGNKVTSYFPDGKTNAVIINDDKGNTTSNTTYNKVGKIISEELFQDNVSEEKTEKKYYDSGQLSENIKTSKVGKVNTYFFTNGKAKQEVTYDKKGNTLSVKNYLEDGTPADNQTKTTIANEFNSMAWNQLDKKDFIGAASSCKEGLKFNSSDLFLWGNLAHSYLFSGNYNDAIAIYRKYLGQNLTKEMPWNDMIKQDFTDFKSKGFDATSMDKVLAELNIK